MKKTRTLCKKYLFLISAILGLLLVVFASIRFPELGEFEPFSDSVSREECEVYEAVIEDKNAFWMAEMIVIEDYTYADSDFLEWDEILRYAKEEFPRLTRRMIVQFKIKNQKPHVLDCSFDSSVPYVFISDKEKKEIFEKGRWEEFYTRYPNSPGFICFSRVAFNWRRDRAIVYIGNPVSYLSGSGSLLFLKNEFGIWTIEDEMSLWIS